MAVCGWTGVEPGAAAVLCCGRVCSAAEGLHRARRRWGCSPRLAQPGSGSHCPGLVHALSMPSCKARLLDQGRLLSGGTAPHPRPGGSWRRGSAPRPGPSPQTAAAQPRPASRSAQTSSRPGSTPPSCTHPQQLCVGQFECIANCSRSFFLLDGGRVWAWPIGC